MYRDYVLIIPIDISHYTHHTVINEVKSVGEYILLPCNITKMNYNKVIWEKNGQSYPVSIHFRHI